MTEKETEKRRGGRGVKLYFYQHQQLISDKPETYGRKHIGES